MAQNIAIFASGSGTNAEKIIEHLKPSEDVNVCLIVSNKPDAFVLKRAKKFNIDSLIISRNQFYKESFLEDNLREKKIDWIVLAGFLWLIPQKLIDLFPNKIINIHPALLPKYGGKGMYGMNVHQAVFDNFEKETGITIHYVNSNYDEGQIIFQESVSLQAHETPNKIAEKVHKLEHEHYPKVLENLIIQNIT